MKPFAGRDLDWNGLGQLAVGDLGVVHPHGHGRALAESASAIAGKIDLELHLALRQRLFAGEREAVHGEVIVDKRGLVVADVRAHGPRVTAVQLRTSSSRVKADLAAIGPEEITEGA